MFFYDFKIQRYFKDNHHLAAQANFSRKLLNITKKQMQKDTNISHATYRRAEVSGFADHPEMLMKLADYFHMTTEFDLEMVDELNSNFNMFYTWVYFGEIDKMVQCFKKIEEKKELYENSVFISIYHFAKVIYYVNSPMRKNIEAIAESVEILKLYREDLLDVFQFLLDEYIYCYLSLTHEKEEALKLVKRVYAQGLKFPRLKALLFYNMSINYYFISDYANSIYYSLEALPLLEQDLNYHRAILCHSNNAICFERLNNSVRSKEILEKLFLYLASNDNPRLLFLAKLTLANCHVSDEEYLEAVEIFKELEAPRETKGENSLMILYCYYKTNNRKSFEELAKQLKHEMNNQNFYKGYYDLVVLLEAMFSKNKRVIVQKFTIAEKSFPSYRDSKIVDIVYTEVKNRKIFPEVA